jgi:hypothetical protein
MNTSVYRDLVVHVHGLSAKVESRAIRDKHFFVAATARVKEKGSCALLPRTFAAPAGPQYRTGSNNTLTFGSRNPNGQNRV